MALNKNPGPKLTSLFKGLVDLIPPEWRAKIGVKQTDQENPVDVGPDSLGTGVVESRVVQTRTDERKKTVVTLEGDLGDTLTSQERLKNGQIATRTRSLLPEGTMLDVPVSAVDGDQKNLGIGYLDQTVLDAELPGPTIYDTKVDRDGVVISIAKTRKLISTITEGESIVSGIWTRIYREGETGLVATEVIESRPIET